MKLNTLTIALALGCIVCSFRTAHAQRLEKVSNMPVGGGVQTLKLLNDSTVFVTIGKNIYKSTDTARTWELIGEFFSNEPYLFMGLAAVSDQKIYSLSTRGGRLRYTHTGKAPWQEITLPVSKRGSDIVMLDENNGVIVLNGNSGSVNQPDILTTSDGGMSWTHAATLPETAYDSKLYFFDKDRGWVLNDRGIYQTRNGGSTWELQVLDSFTRTATGMHMLSATKGFLCAGGELYATDNGGSSWTPVPGADFNAVHDVAFVSQSVGYAVGRRSSKSWVYKTTDGGNTWKEIVQGEWIEKIAIHNSVVLFTGTNNNVWRLYDEDSPVSSVPTITFTPASVYPNPVRNSVLYMELKEAIRSVTVTDITGKQVFAENTLYPAGLHTLALPHSLMPGVYFVTLTSPGNRQQVIRLVKE